MTRQKLGRYAKLFIIVTLILCGSLFSSNCRVELIPDGGDILGFISNNEIVSNQFIEDGVIVTSEFIVQYKQMMTELERCRRK